MNFLFIALLTLFLSLTIACDKSETLTGLPIIMSTPPLLDSLSKYNIALSNLANLRFLISIALFSTLKPIRYLKIHPA